jgi:hypothetical protein
MNVIKAIYNFIVGDMIILIGVAIVAVALGIINFAVPDVGRVIAGPVLIVAVLVVLFATLFRETRGR